MKVSDEKIITVLLSSKTNAEAARTLGLNERYLYDRTREESFQRKLKAAQERILEDAVADMRLNLKEAASVVVDVMKDTENSPQTRVNAADTLIRSFLRLSERADILDRLDKLEAEFDL